MSMVPDVPGMSKKEGEEAAPGEEGAPAEEEEGLFGKIGGLGSGLMDGVKGGLDKGMSMVPDVPGMSKKEGEEAAPGEEGAPTEEEEGLFGKIGGLGSGLTGGAGAK